jgi:hypothetical protein
MSPLLRKGDTKRYCNCTECITNKKYTSLAGTLDDIKMTLGFCWRSVPSNEALLVPFNVPGYTDWLPARFGLNIKYRNSYGYSTITDHHLSLNNWQILGNIIVNPKLMWPSLDGFQTTYFKNIIVTRKSVTTITSLFGQTILCFTWLLWFVILKFHIAFGVWNELNMYVFSRNPLEMFNQYQEKPKTSLQYIVTKCPTCYKTKNTGL